MGVYRKIGAHFPFHGSGGFQVVVGQVVDKCADVHAVYGRIFVRKEIELYKVVVKKVGIKFRNVGHFGVPAYSAR